MQCLVAVSAVPVLPFYTEAKRMAFAIYPAAP
jgi:hypothetical protein